MIAAGVKAEVIAAAVEAGEQEIRDHKREQGRERQRRFRNARKRDSNATERDVTLSRVTSLHTNETIETIEDFKASADADDKDAPSYLLTSTEDSLRKKERKSARARVAKGGPIPDGWKPTAQHFAVAAKFHVDLGDCEERFRDYCASSGKQYADHDAAFRNFIKNQPNFNGKGNGNGRRKSVQDAARDLHEAAKRGEVDFFEDRLADQPRAFAVRMLPKG